jgi:hypothetical protein
LLGATVPVTWWPPCASVLSWNKNTASPLAAVKVVPSVQVNGAPATGILTTWPGLAAAGQATPSKATRPTARAAIAIPNRLRVPIIELLFC